MNEADTKELLAKLDTIIRLVVLGIAEGKDQTEQIRLLSLAGFQPKKIPEMLGTTANNVRVRLSTLRKKRKAYSL